MVLCLRLEDRGLRIGLCGRVRGWGFGVLKFDPLVVEGLGWRVLEKWGLRLD